MEQLSKQYLSHKVFRNIKYAMHFYDRLSHSCFPFIPIGTKGLSNFMSYMFEAMSGTLDSVSLLLKRGRINDALTLLRTYYDDVLYGAYIELHLKQEEIKSVVDGNFTFSDNEINDWLASKHSLKRISEIRSLLITSNETSELYSFFNDKMLPKEYREFLDDSVHRNKYIRLLVNCNQVCLDNREKYLDSFDVITTAIFTMHLSFLFLLSPAYMMASDYIDMLEAGLTPNEGSERYVASFAQEAFDKYIKPHLKLAVYLKNNVNLDIQ